MLSRARPDDLPLGGIDIFHLRTDDELRHHWGERNSCAIFAELDGRIDLRELDRRLERGPDGLRWSLHRTLRTPYCWRPGTLPPRVTVRALGSASPLEAAVEALRVPVDERRPFHVVVLRGKTHDAVALVWFHAITDARGATRVLDGLGRDLPPPRAPFLTSDRLLAKLEGEARRQLTTSYIDHAFGLGRRPILSLESTTTSRPGPQHAIRWRLSTTETEAFEASLRARAGLADTSLVLWATSRLLDRIMAARGFCPPRQVVPVPVSLDPKRGCERLFGNHLTMMLLALEREELDDEGTAVQSLARQRREVIRGKLDVGMITAMRSTAWMPWPVVNHLSRRPFAGERSSYVLSNPGELPLTELFGAPVIDAVAMPTVPSPGLMVTTDRFAARRSVLFSYREGILPAHELRAQLPDFKHDLLGS